MTANFGEKEVINSRKFEVPRAKVFNAWSNPELLARWWGPNGFTNTFEQFDFRSGGEWRFVMHGPDGKSYQNLNVFKEIIPLERVVIHHVYEPEFVLTATFEEEGEQTILTWRQRIMDPAAFEKVKSFAHAANEQNFDRLNEVLSDNQSA